MVMPWDRLFFEPQNTMVTRSARGKPSHLLTSPVAISAAASGTPATSSPASAEGGTLCHRPSPTASLKAE
jgi:hypothetical protein